MVDLAQEAVEVIRPYGRSDYFNGCESRKVSTIVELPADLTERFIDVLDARDSSGQVDSKVLYQRVMPIGLAVGVALRGRLAEVQPEPICRKGSMKNCGINVSKFSAIVLQTEEGTLEPHIPAHVECSAALINKVPSNEAAAAPVAVDNAPLNLQFDIGCMAQMTVVGELAGQMMLDILIELEAARAEVAQA